MPDIIGFLVQNPIVLILIIEGLGGAVAILSMFFYNKNRFQVYIMAKNGKTWRIIKKMKVKMDDSEFKWKKEFCYKIDFSCAIMDNKGKPILFYFFENALPIKIFDSNKINIEADSRTFRVANDGKILEKTSNRRIDKLMMFIIIGLVIGIAIIAIYSLYLNSVTTKDIITIARELVNATKTNGNVIPIG